MDRTPCKLIGQDGNIFVLMGAARKALKRDDKHKEAAEMTKRVTETATSYDDALRIIFEYVEDEGELDDD